MIKQSQSNIGEAIDTDVECGPVGMIPEWGLALRSSKTQDDIGRSVREPEASGNLLFKKEQIDIPRRDVST